ncbi:ABC transporter substrate-binding protein [Candidatus Solirubrobacter pratensis]|uniref:ABC transporter substrate-binding protein n=1 Tax=Candidatus Solirubrobacter pratensis TaxID=1298857 RepID=UPI0009DBE0F5|nr:ABC transporter substrate-binding protein [Candidatus Solirubrobacter pratensis]
MSSLHHPIRRRAGRAVLAGAMAIAIGAAAAGCGGGSSSNSGSGGTPATAQDDSTLIVAQPEDLQNLDPTLSSGDQVTQEMLTNVYDWLVDYKVADADGKPVGDANQFVPAIAQSMTWNKSHTVLTFKLRKGLKFLNGNPLDAQAVKDTYDRVFNQKGVTASLISMAAVKDKNAVTVKGDDTVQFHLDKANNLLLGNMAQFGNSILDPKLIAQHKTASDPFAHDWLSTNVGGGAQGPYQLQSWTSGSQWVLTANPSYRGPQPKIQKIIFKVIPDPSTRYQLLQSGAVDIAFGLPLKDIQKAKQNADIQIVNEPSRNVVFLGMNSKTKPFDNVKVRQAINYAVPYKTIIDKVLLGYGQQMTSPIPLGTPTHTDKFNTYTTDLNKAKALLAQAGFPKGFSTTLQVASGNDQGKQTAIWVQQSLKQIGVKVTINQLPGATYNSRLQKHQLGFFFFNNWISINNDPFYHLYWLFDSDCCNYTNYDNAQVKSLIDKDLLSDDEATRDADSVKIQQMIMNDAPWSFLYQPNYVVAMRSNVKGYTYFPADTFTRYRYLYKSGKG